MTTIFALSSGRLPAGIAVVRISGPEAFTALALLTRRPLPVERLMVVRKLTDPSGDHLDTAMVVRFVAPNSATGEDLAELHLHGSVAIVASVMRTLATIPGLQLARAGEFTRRAFHNCKLDLTEVEGLGDVMSAETDAQRRQALFNASGGLRTVVDTWRTSLIAIRADLEATLDFADEDDVPTTLSGTNVGRLKAIIEDIEEAVLDFRRGEQIRDALTVAITGPPNVGKSSLLNALARREVAIVSPHAGTTRDLIEIRLDLDGVAVAVYDTAGQRDSIDPIEIEGMRRGCERATAADLVITLGYVSADIDAVHVEAFGDVHRKVGWHDKTLWLSTLTLDGIDLLLDWLTGWAHKTVRPSEPVLISRERHLNALSQALVEFRQARDCRDVVLVAEHLRLATTALDSIVGRISAEAILDNIFASFCIGK